MEPMVAPQAKAALLKGLYLGVLIGSLAAPAPILNAQSAPKHEDEGRWLAVAPGRVEPVSGEIKIATAAMGLIGEVLVKTNDKVFAGEPLIRLSDNEVQARFAAAEAQVALRRRARNAESPSAKAAARRRAEDG